MRRLQAKGPIGENVLGQEKDKYTGWREGLKGGWDSVMQTWWGWRVQVDSKGIQDKTLIGLGYGGCISCLLLHEKLPQA